MFGSNMSAVATPSPPSLILYCSLQTGILIGISIWAPKSRRGHSTWPRDRETHTRTQTNTHYTHSAHTNIAKAAFCSCFFFFILAAPKTALSTILALPLTTPPSSANHHASKPTHACVIETIHNEPSMSLYGLCRIANSLLPSRLLLLLHTLPTNSRRDVGSVPVFNCICSFVYCFFKLWLPSPLSPSHLFLTFISLST